MSKPTDVQVREVTFELEDHRYRAPMKFGGAVVDQVTLLNVRVLVRSCAGVDAWGFGSMPLGNVWSFPSRRLRYDQTLCAMKMLAERLVGITAQNPVTGHPIDINHTLEPLYLEAAAAVTAELHLPEPIPKLCTLVVASPIDAAIHDAFGKANNINCYHGYGPAHMSRGLGFYLESSFGGEFPDRYLARFPKSEMPVYHLVGALDPVFASDVTCPVGDGLPESLGEWILADGLTHIKIKLDGSDLNWDTSRVLAVNQVAETVQGVRGVATWHYSLDFNERCADPDYLLDFLRQIRSASPQTFARIQYIEQPTSRDLRANPDHRMHAVAAMKPVVIDESLVDYESLLLARDLGYSGVALKACKGQSACVLMAAAARKFDMFLCVQDLTCPGASLLHSAGVAAHVPTVAAIEANARQYVPAANRPWSERFPGIFRMVEGRMQTGVLQGPGLGIAEQEISCRAYR
jgi:L-alanine-DL-glutamate epimerase-like enolase superfamily enzyme